VALFGRELLGSVDISYESLGAALELVSEQGNGFVMPKWVPTPGNRKFHHTMAEVEAVIYRVIEAGRRRPPSDGTLLSMLIHSIDAETNRPLTDQELRDEVFTLFVAGHETTALTLTWLFTLLAGRDEVMTAMKEEVDRVLGGREPGFEDYPRLTYLRQVVDETLRLRGPLAMTARNAVADDEVMGMRVRPGDVVLPYFYGAQRHRDFWTDPERFDPGHFAPEKPKPVELSALLGWPAAVHRQHLLARRDGGAAGAADQAVRRRGRPERAGGEAGRDGDGAARQAGAGEAHASRHPGLSRGRRCCAAARFRASRPSVP
jgi:cytochrome P450